MSSQDIDEICRRLENVWTTEDEERLDEQCDRIDTLFTQIGGRQVVRDVSLEIQDDQSSNKAPHVFDSPISEQSPSTFSFLRLNPAGDFYNKKFNTRGKKYVVKVVDRPEGDDRLVSFHTILLELVDILNESVLPTDYVQLVFTSSDLTNPFFVPVVRFDLFDVRVAVEQFANILSSNAFVDVGRGDFTIKVYHTRVPLGGGKTSSSSLQNSFGIATEDWLRRKKSILTIPQEWDPHCLIFAVHLALAHQQKKHRNFFPCRAKGKKLKMRWAVDFRSDCNLPTTGELPITALKKIAKHPLFRNHPFYVYERQVVRQIFRCNEKASDSPIHLLHFENHFSVITSLPGIFDKKKRGFYCPKCDKNFPKKRLHVCGKAPCTCCKGFCASTPCGENSPYRWSRQCDSCLRFFKSPQCFANHLKKGATSLFSAKKSCCDVLYKCQTCSVTLKKNAKGEETGKQYSTLKPHICGTVYCVTCRRNVDKYTHLCFMQTLDEKEIEEKQEKERGINLFFDIESLRQEGSDLLQTNLIIVQDENGCEWSFEGLSAVEEFSQSLFDREKGELYAATVGAHGYAYFYAHNGARFDFLPFVTKMYRYTSETPNVVFDGSSLLRIELFNKKLIFLDSYRFLPMPLAALPVAFGVESVKKGFFPYRLNSDKSWDKVVLNVMPEDFEVEHMNAAKRKEFEQWYSQELQPELKQKAEMNDLAGEDKFGYDVFTNLKSYCQDDVSVLRKCFMKFYDACRETTGILPGIGNMTIASLCNRIWRAKFLEKDLVGLIPHRGYVQNDVQSRIALVWLSFLDQCYYANDLKFARKDKGEKKITLEHTFVKVDGFHQESNTIFEFYGCEWHGCQKCYTDTSKSFLTGLPMIHLYSAMKQRELRLIDLGYNLETIWECEWLEELKNEETKDLILEIDPQIFECIRDPLNPRDALHGGRVDCYRMWWNLDFFPNRCVEDVHAKLKDEHLEYMDVTSLYPTINKYGKYPVGHPTILRNNALIRTTLPLDYCGLYSCKILPPKDLFHPVLPFAITNSEKPSSPKKKMYVLCRTCAILKNFHLNSCTHTDEERSLTGVWITPEIELALSKGYKILEAYEVWDYSRVKTGLAEDYINHFLKGKQEAAGWPKNAVTPEERTEYIENYARKEGVKLDASKISEERNKALYTLNKSALNCWWGKLAEQQERRQSKLVNSVSDFYTFLADDDQKEKKFIFVDEENLLLHSRQKHHAIATAKKGNIVLGAFTTGLARIHLYTKMLDKVGTRAVYCDTDSCVYKAGYRVGPSLPVGSFLGDLTNELENDRVIGEWACGGPKHYGYRSYKLTGSVEDDDFQKTEFKCKGVVNTHHTNERISFHKMKEILFGVDDALLETNNLPTDEISYQKFSITRGCGEGVFTDPFSLRVEFQTKSYRLFFDKRVIDAKTGITYPFGYRGELIEN